MRYNKILILIIILLIIVSYNTLFSKESVGELSRNLLKILKTYHYNKLSLDDKVLMDIKKTFLYYLDPYRLYFTQNDINFLLSINISEIKHEDNKTVKFYDESIKCYKNRLKEVDVIISNIYKIKFDYTLEEYISFTSDINSKYPNNNDELELQWKKWIKYKVLDYIFYSQNDNSNSNDIRKLLENEEEIKIKICKSERDYIHELMKNKNFNEYVSSVFLNAIANRYDPNTVYMSSKQKNNFEADYSKEAYSFGLYLSTNYNGDVIIEKLVPGGPAWNSSQLNKGDIIIKLSFTEKGSHVIDFYDLTEYEANEIISSINSENIVLTVKKANSVIKKVRLKKDKIQIEENIISSFILNDDFKIGYIYLPGFYTDWEIVNKPGCANDIAKEIIKLKRENINGLILDLRYNSGGSLYEALDIAGIFIDEGPFVIQGNRDEKPSIIKDKNRGTIYDGPLILLINEQSASSSEFLAAILKDYNRALIVGSPSYGKATSQIILPIVEDIKNIYSSNNNKDFVKLTINKYYNLSGKTHQLTGVLPDIFLPGYLGFLYSKEKDMPFALVSDEISRKVVYNKYQDLKKSVLIKKSNARILKNKSFIKIKTLNEKMKKYFDEGNNYSLNINQFMNEMKNENEMFESLDGVIHDSSEIYKVGNTEFDKEILDFDSYRKEVNEDLKKQIKEDVYIKEAFLIMNDLIKINK